jgi:regulator of protease activity HflC (stomatin/prohibitin superfamily)
MVGVLLTLIFVIYFWSSVFVSINSGFVAVRWSPLTGTSHGRLLTDGLNIVFPWDEITQYDTRIQERTDTTYALTKTGLDVKVYTSTRFHLPANHVVELQETVGPDYVRKIVHPEVTSAVRRVIGNYTMEQIYAQEAGTHSLQDLHDQVAAEFDDRVVTFDHFAVLRIALPDSIEQAIQNKLVAEQVEQSQEFVLQTAEFQAKKRAIDAQGYADFARITGMSVFQWRQLEVAEEFAKSPNAKTIVLGGTGMGLPFVIQPGK